jgi:hypothetical protein
VEPGAGWLEALLPLLHEDADEGVKLAENALKGFQAAYHGVFHPWPAAQDRPDDGGRWRPPAYFGSARRHG